MRKRIYRSDTVRAKSVLRGSSIVANKSRGQNFLTQAAIADRIIDALEPRAGDHVAEIGPGLGILTERLIRYPLASLTLFELDRALAQRLRENAQLAAQVTLIEGDFLHADLDKSVRDGTKVIGNLPFNAAAAIFRKLCDAHRRLSTMVLMFQREVGERLRAGRGDTGYSALSVFRALYFDVDLYFRVHAGSFYPRPKVDAEVIRLRPRAQPAFTEEEEAAVLETVRASFAAPRKMIRNSLAGAMPMDARLADEALDRARISPSARAESLSPDDFVKLAAVLRRQATPKDLT